MDIIAHGLWTYVAAGKQRVTDRLRWLVFFGILPDLVWLPTTLWWLVTAGQLQFSTPLYDVSHSLVVWLGFTFVATLYDRRAYLVTWPWALHILVDIPGHLGGIRTPILWPLSHLTFPGWWSWLSVPWLIANYAVLAFLIAGIAIRKKESAGERPRLP